MAAASRSVSRALRSNIARQVVAPAVQKRSLVLAATSAAKAAVATAPRRPPKAAVHIQQRGLKTIDFAGTKEVVYGASDFIDLGGGVQAANRVLAERADWPLEKLQVSLYPTGCGREIAQRWPWADTFRERRNTSKMIPLP